MLETSHFHPMLVHFPIAIVLLGFVVIIIEQFLLKNKPVKYHCGEYLLYISTIFAVITVLSGELFTGSFGGTMLEIRDSHRIMAYLTTFTLAISSVFYLIARLYAKANPILRNIGFIFYALAAICVGITGAIGGTLVYNYMIGL